jgi:thioesterase domain-containing protein
LLGYSFGGLLALELALELEAEGQEGQLYLLDTSPDISKALLEYDTSIDEEEFYTNLICRIFRAFAPNESTAAALTKVSHVIN